MANCVFGCNHLVLEVGHIEKAVECYSDVLNLKLKDHGARVAFSNLAITSF